MTHLQQNEKTYKKQRMSNMFSDWAAKEIKTLEKQAAGKRRAYDQAE